MFRYFVIHRLKPALIIHSSFINCDHLCLYPQTEGKSVSKLPKSSVATKTSDKSSTRGQTSKSNLAAKSAMKSMVKNSSRASGN